MRRVSRFLSRASRDRPVKHTERADAIAEMSRDSVWLYSQMKSGTTFVIVFLLVYVTESTTRGVSRRELFDKLPYFHSFGSVMKKHSIARIREEQRELLDGSGVRYLLHTHAPVHDRSERRVLLTRNPLDFLVSSYFFHHRNRGSEAGIESLWESILEKYVANELAQHEILRTQPETSLLVRYENLVRRPAETLASLLRFLGLAPEEDLLQVALSRSRPEEIKEIERVGGAPLVAGPGFAARSFIRSGEIGEWKEHISPRLQRDVLDHLSARGVDLSAHVFE